MSALGSRITASKFERHQAGETAQGIGYSNEVAGGFAQFMPLAEWLLLEVSNGLPAERAALTEPIAVGWHAVQHARLRLRMFHCASARRAGEKSAAING